MPVPYGIFLLGLVSQGNTFAMWRLLATMAGGIKFNESWTAIDRSLSLLESAKVLRALHFYHDAFCAIYTDRMIDVDIGELGKHCTLDRVNT